MSRRKQARPKSCKLEGSGDKREEEADSAALTGDSPPADSDCSKVNDLNEGTSCSKTETSADKEANAQEDQSSDSRTGGNASNVFRCDTCNAVFETLDHFMDHRNFVCGNGSAVAGLNWSSQDKPEWSGSDSASASPVPVNLDEGVKTPLPLHLSEEQLPFAIGISQANPYGCQFCEKAFPQTRYLHVHERVHSDQLPYKCEHCQRLFQNKRNRDRHSKLHASERKVKCSRCRLSFSRKDELLAHMRNSECSKLYQCPMCDSGFSSAVTLTAHLLTHQDLSDAPRLSSSVADSLSCVQCGQSFETSQLLQEHMSIHTAAIKVERLSCDVCSQPFGSQESLDAHMEQHYRRPPAPHAHSAMEVDPAALLLKCPMCPHSFADTLALCQHLMTHTAAAAAAMTLTPDLDPVTASLTLARGRSGSKDNAGGGGSLRRSGSGPGSSPGKEGGGGRSRTPKQSALASSSSSSSSSREVSSPGRSTGLGHHQGASSSQQQALVCPYCLNDGFESLEGLELHMQSLHSVKQSEIYTCNYCNAPYPNLYSLHDHMNVVHRSHPAIGIRYPCSLCNNQFPSIEALAKHKALSHNYHDGQGGGESGRHSAGGGGGGGVGGIDSAFCSQCSLTFPTAGQLEDHMVSVHGASVVSAAVEKKGGKARGRKSASGSASSVATGGGGGGGGGKGNKENKQSLAKSRSARQQQAPSLPSPSSASLLSSSLSAAEASLPAPASISPVRSSASTALGGGGASGSAASGVGAGGGESITCDECNATFHEVGNFRAHMKLHLDAALAKFTCKRCGQQLGSQEQLEAHLSLHYLCLATEYGCTSCVKLFSKPDELQKHLMDIHAHHLYRCALCKEIFDSKVNIQVHFAIKHSNECKLFKCTQCPNIFRSEMEWQVHVRVNHLHLAKPYRCLFCAESFTSEMELQCHLTTHSKPFRCTMCEQAFHIEYLLDQHMQTEHADADTKAAVAAALLSSPALSAANSTPSSSTAHNLSSVSIKEEADSSTSILSSLMQVRSPRPPSHSSEVGKSLSPTALPPQPSPSPLATALSLSSPSSFSSVWKNSEAVHVCNICDSRFTQQALLAIHKAQEHGLRPAGSGSGSGSGVSSLSPTAKGGSSSVSPLSGFAAPPHAAHSQTSREKFLQQNQTLVSVLTAEIQSSNNSGSGSSNQMACSLCSQTFRNQVECDKHMKIHANSTSLRCNICDENFPSGSTLAEHKLQHCKIQQGNICFVCKLPLKTEEQFYSHAQEHGYQGSLLQCVVCRQSLASVVELQMHGRHHYQVRPSFYTCCVCLHTFHSKENLVAKLNSSGRTYYVCKPCYHGEAPLHTCPHCSEKFASRSLLDAHTATHTHTHANLRSPALSVKSEDSGATVNPAGPAPQTYQCIKCQESFSTEYEIQLHVAHHMLQEGTSHECKLCTLVFESPAKLQCHLIEHAYKKEADFRCTVCSQVFGSAAEIQVHVLEHGVQGRKHMCGQCSQRFFFSSELDNHVLIYNHAPASIPAAEASLRYECRDCNKAFGSATALVNHRKTHKRQDSNLKCSLCTQTFSSVGLMQQHFVVAHMGEEDGRGGEGESGSRMEESHSCKQCSQHFSSADSLQAHVDSAHKSGDARLSCPVCNRTFSQAKMLTIHLRSHTESKPFPCSVCQKRFSREENLKAHMKSHAGVPPPLICPLCNQSFSEREDITEHLKTHFVTSEGEQDISSAQPGIQDSSSASEDSGSCLGIMAMEENASTAVSNDLAVMPQKDGSDARPEASEGALELVIPNPKNSNKT